MNYIRWRLTKSKRIIKRLIGRALLPFCKIGYTYNRYGIDVHYILPWTNNVELNITNWHIYTCPIKSEIIFDKDEAIEKFFDLAKPEIVVNIRSKEVIKCNTLSEHV